MLASSSSWIFFLLVGSHTSKPGSESTGSPQGCVLSPLLFLLLTHNPHCHLQTQPHHTAPDDTPWWWVSSAVGIKQHTRWRWSSWQRGAATTVLSSNQGDVNWLQPTCNMALPWPLGAALWRGVSSWLQTWPHQSAPRSLFNQHCATF